MANTTPTFLRRFEVFAPILAGKSAPILESVHITLGFKGPIDAESGMVLNLAEVDSWIKEFKLGSNKKSFSSRWDFSLHIKNKFAKIINRPEFVDVRIEFHDLGIQFTQGNTFIKWTRRGLVQTKKLKWLSPVVLTLQVQTRKWPPVSKSAHVKINESLEHVHLEKLNWNIAGLEFSSFEFIDPKLGSTVRALTLK